MPEPGYDDWMDDQLRSVPVPHDLHERLQSARPSADELAAAQAGERDPGDVRLDALLRNVEVPIGLHQRLRSIARRNILAWPGRETSRRTWVAAASVAILATASAYLVAVRGSGQAPQAEVADQSSSNKEAPGAGPVATVEPTPATEQAVERKPRRQEPITVPLGRPLLAEGESHKLLENVAGVSTSIRKAIDAKMRAQYALGAGGQIEPLPDLRVLEQPISFGVTPPRVRGYDMLFQLRHGEHPFVTPAVDTLAISQVPFTFRTASYDRAAENISGGRLPDREDVRVEDFLAAQQYVLPAAPAGGVVLHAAACPSPLGEADKHLLQLVVQGGQGRRNNRKPTRIIAVVDTSSAMQAGARDKMAVRALAKLGKHLQPGDNLTLIGFSEAPRVLLENAGRDELAALSASGGLEATSGSADLLAAVQTAAEAVAASPNAEARRVVFITAGGRLEGVRRDAARDSLKQLTAAGAGWDFVELAPRPDEDTWQDLTREARGRAANVNSADELFAVCLEALTGREADVARNVSLRIRFNPKAVASYRMLGHEAATLTGDADDPLVVDLHAGQTATCMYELWLRRDGKGDLAHMELTWQDPTGGQPRRQVQPIRAAALAGSFSQAPPWLQQGVVAARTAEFLRGSYHLPNARRLGQLLELARDVDSSVAKSPEFRGLVRLIEQAERLR